MAKLAPRGAHGRPPARAHRARSRARRSSASESVIWVISDGTAIDGGGLRHLRAGWAPVSGAPAEGTLALGWALPQLIAAPEAGRGPIGSLGRPGDPLFRLRRPVASSLPGGRSLRARTAGMAPPSGSAGPLQNAPALLTEPPSTRVEAELSAALGDYSAEIPVRVLGRDGVYQLGRDPARQGRGGGGRGPRRRVPAVVER